MIFSEVKEREFLDFMTSHTQASSYQLPGWGELKKINGWKYYLVGMKEKNKLVAAVMLLEKNTPIKKKIFYAPRGFILDYHDKKILTEFVDNVKKYVKSLGGFMLKVDPNVIYQLRNKDGEEISEVRKNDEAITNLKELGFKHLGFNQAFETMQPRFLCRFSLKDNYDDVIQSFSKTTRKHILELDSLGVQVKVATKDEIRIAVSLLDETANRKKMAKRPSSYYEKMKECLGDYLDIFLCYLEKKSVIRQIKKNIKEEEEAKEIVLAKMKTDNVGKKLTQQLETAESKLKKQQELLQFVESFEEEIIYIGSLFSVWIGDEGITFLSGTNERYRKFLPKYALYNAHIKKALEKKKKYVNFYGISGVFDPKDENYGIYEVKKGFNPEVVELIGEFDLVIQPLYYWLYNVAFKVYKKSKG